MLCSLRWRWAENVDNTCSVAVAAEEEGDRHSINRAVCTPSCRCTFGSTFPDLRGATRSPKLQLQLIWSKHLSCVTPSAGVLNCVQPVNHWAPPCLSPSPCLHSRRAFPGTSVYAVSMSGGGWSFVCWSYMHLRHAVKFTAMPLAMPLAISEVNLYFPDSARAAVSNKPTSQKPPF